MVLATVLAMTGCADGNTDHPTAGGGVTDEAAEQAPSPSAVHPDFSLTADDLDMLTDGMPPEIRARIADRPTVFLERAKDLQKKKIEGEKKVKIMGVKMKKRSQPTSSSLEVANMAFRSHK